MIPTSHEYTVAVDAAAKAAYDADTNARRKVFPPSAEFPGWDDLEPAHKLAVREAVLPVVDAALRALPDRRREAWLEGQIAGAVGLDSGDNPYPETEG